MLPADAVRPVGTLHLTLGVMSFPRDEEGEGRLKRAGEVLSGLGLRGLWSGVRAAQGQDQVQTQTQTQEGVGVGDTKTAGAPAAEDTARGGDGRGVERRQQGKAEEEEEEEERPKITLKGLASMQPADKAAVLYAPPVDQDGLLQAFCEKVRGVFTQAELMVDEGRPLLLHATVVNTVYVKGNKKEAGGSRGRGARGGRGGQGREEVGAARV